VSNPIHEVLPGALVVAETTIPDAKLDEMEHEAAAMLAIVRALRGVQPSHRAGVFTAAAMMAITMAQPAKATGPSEGEGREEGEGNG
jgi:hypothetical protein